ncbi:MAG: carboxypeptidase-like regulatory domain-containing protein [Tepidisphaeraceae bacterium]
MRYRSAFTAAAVLASAGGIFAQTTPGAIQGKLLSADGKPIPRASIYYGRSGRTTGKAAASVLPPVLSAKAGLDGSFTLPNLTPGGWIVCVEAAGYLNPCHWSTAPAFTVAAGQTISNATVHMDQACTLQIRVKDPQGLLANEGKVAGAVLQIGVRAPSGAFQRATLAGKDSSGRNYTVAIPLKVAASLFVSGGAFQLNDDSGLQLANNGKVTPVTAPDTSKPGAAPAAALGFTITGLTRP